jgi:hypothetical protein
MAACVPPEELVGYGTLLQYVNPINEQWQTVAGTKDLSFPEDVTDSIETTDNSSGGYRTRIPNPLASLEAQTYEMKFLWSQFSVMREMKGTQVITEWRLVLMNPQQSYMKFCAFISKIGGEIPMEDLVMASIELTPTGGPTWGTLA